MVQSCATGPDPKLLARARQLQQARDVLVKMHGAHSETVALIEARLEVVRGQLQTSTTDRTDSEAHTGDILETWGAPKNTDSSVLYVLIGGVVLVAVGAMSTMFIVMLAVKW